MQVRSGVQYVYEHVFSDDKIIARSAAKAIGTVRSECRDNGFTKGALEKYHYCYQLVDFSKKNLDKLRNFPPEQAVHLYGVASQHDDASVRDRVLDYLQRYPVPEILPYTRRLSG